MKTKNHAGFSKNAFLLLVLGLIILSSTSLLISNNDRAAGFPVTIPPRHIIIQINPGAYDPNSLHPLNLSTVTVPPGSNVTWINKDVNYRGVYGVYGTHTITSGDPINGPSNIFYSSKFGFGRSFTVTFDQPGVYPYYDRDYKHIKGQVIVR